MATGDPRRQHRPSAPGSCGAPRPFPRPGACRHRCARTRRRTPHLRCRCSHCRRLPQLALRPARPPGRHHPPPLRPTNGPAGSIRAKSDCRDRCGSVSTTRRTRSPGSVPRTPSCEISSPGVSASSGWEGDPSVDDMSSTQRCWSRGLSSRQLKITAHQCQSLASPPARRIVAPALCPTFRLPQRLAFHHRPLRLVPARRNSGSHPDHRRAAASTAPEQATSGESVESVPVSPQLLSSTACCRWRVMLGATHFRDRDYGIEGLCGSFLRTLTSRQFCAGSTTGP